MVVNLFLEVKGRTFSTIYCYKKAKQTTFFIQKIVLNMCIFEARNQHHNTNELQNHFICTHLCI